MSFQTRVYAWMLACFNGDELAASKQERNHRFGEEALELLQATGCTRSEVDQLVDYVYSRPAGDPAQEVGGVLGTLALLCAVSGIDMQAAGEQELARVWTKIDQIRAKHAAKPQFSPLPGPSESEAEPDWPRVLRKAPLASGCPHCGYRHPPDGTCV